MLEGPEMDAFVEGQPAMPVVNDVPKDPAWPLVGRVLVLPRSTFARVGSEDLRIAPLALAILAFTALLKGGIAAVFLLRQAGGPAARLALAVGIRYGADVIGPLLFAAAMAGVLVLAQRAWQGDAPFGVLLSATSLALMPLAVRNVVQAVYMGVTRAPLLHPGLSALFGRVPGSLAGKLAYAALMQIDAFTLWAFVLLALAAAVTHGRGLVKPVLTVTLAVLVWVAAVAGLMVLAP